MSERIQPGRSRVRVAIAALCGGLIAGTVDIGAASLIGGLSPIVILHAIASGVLGRASFVDGAASALLGLVLQWAMSLVIAAVFVVAARANAMLLRLWVPCGLVYGVLIFVVMHYVVVPLSVAPFRNAPMTGAKLAENLAAMLVFGLIIAAATRLSAGSPPRATATGDASTGP